MIQTEGIAKPRCGSFARIGLPLCVRSPETTQLFDPTPWLPTSPAPRSKPARLTTVEPMCARSARAEAFASLSAATVAIEERALPGAAAVPADAPAPPEPARPVGVMTGAVVSYAGKSSSVLAVLPRRASARSRKISLSTLLPSDHAWTFCQVAVSSGVHGSSVTPPIPPDPDNNPATTNGVDKRPLCSLIQAFTPSA